MTTTSSRSHPFVQEAGNPPIVDLLCSTGTQGEPPRAIYASGCLQLPGFGEIDSHKLTHVPRGRQLNVQRKNLHLMVVVAQGLIKVTQTLPNGRCQIVALVYPGELIIPYAATRSADYTVEAAARSTVFVSDLAQVDTVESGKLEWDRLLAAQLQTALVRAHKHLVTLGRKRPVERLASFLIELELHQQNETSEPNACIVPLLRADIADYLGLESETVSRLFKQLKTVGVIDVIKPSLIKILDAQRLTQMAEGTCENAVASLHC